MVETKEFEKWIESAHTIFEIFEGRYDAYPLARKWVEEWFTSSKFVVIDEDSERLNQLKENFDYTIFGIKKRDMIDRIDSQFAGILKSLKDGQGEKGNLGFAIAPYLFTWNFKRFRKYFKKDRNFSLSRYFQDLGEWLKDGRGKLKAFRARKLLKSRINETEISEIFDSINNRLKQLGINDNEPVGTAKLLHIIEPYYFPLIDNRIAEVVGLKNPNVSLTSSDYYKWMVHLKRWLQARSEIIERVEQQFNSSILKLVDEGFYVMSSINLSLRLGTLGIVIGDY